MHIVVSFQFHGDKGPSAQTGVEGDVTDLVLPSVGDVVEHRDAAGAPFRGRVTERLFKYDLPNGTAVMRGMVSITLCMERTLVH